MFKIGEFSKLSKVSVKALRHYDDLGLLAPAAVDRFTSYRYYTADQLPRLNRILALKDLGLSLEEIRRLLAEGLPAAELRGMLRIKQAELERHLAEEHARLGRVAARLQQIEAEDAMPTHEVIVKEVPALRVASVRAIIPTFSAQGPLWDDLAAYLVQHGLRPNAACLTIYHDEEYRERDVDAEVCEPVDAPLGAAGHVTVYDLPACKVAATVHHGSYDGLNSAYGALMGWIGANGYRIAGPNREIYLRNHADHGVGPEDLVTEVQFPVEQG
jgi:DNA-binding transcriptional MerR regulator